MNNSSFFLLDEVKIVFNMENEFSESGKISSKKFFTKTFPFHEFIKEII